MEKNIVSLYNIYATIIALLSKATKLACLKACELFIIYSKAVFFKKFYKKS